MNGGTDMSKKLVAYFSAKDFVYINILLIFGKTFKNVSHYE